MLQQLWQLQKSPVPKADWNEVAASMVPRPSLECYREAPWAQGCVKQEQECPHVAYLVSQCYLVPTILNFSISQAPYVLVLSMSPADCHNLRTRMSPSPL